MCRHYGIVNQLRGVKAAARITAVLAALQFSCDRMPYPLRPFVHSLAPMSGVVRDSLSDAPIASATVRIGENGQTGVTGADGIFRFSVVPTGTAVVTVSASGYTTLDTTVDVTFDPMELTWRLARSDAPPRLDTVTIDSGSLRFFDDPVTITFRATDSSGGIVGAVLFTGDTGVAARVERRLPFAAYALVDSFTVQYPSPGVWKACLQIIGARGDAVRDSFTISTRRPARPGFSLLRTAQGGFLAGEPGYLQVDIADPDSAFTRMSIDWGDGGASENLFALRGVYWHVYRSDGDAYYDIAVTLFDDAGAVNRKVVAATVSEINPPLLDGRLYFEPSQYLAPHDTAILIGVRVRDIEEYVQEIIWIINENDPEPAFEFQRVELGPIRGELPDSSALFVSRFSTAGFKGVNDVRIMVVDRYGNVSTVSGSFYIAGRPGG